MSQFRAGDRYVDVGGQGIRLRLSLSALAEITSQLEAKSSSELAVRLRRSDRADWDVIWAAMATPRPISDLTQAQMGEVIPLLSEMISESFAA